MAVAPALRRPRDLKLKLDHPAVAIVAGIALTVFAGYLRSRAIHARFWIDEGLSVGIAQHPFTDIPHVLLQDGSPPLWYMLLHLWMSVFGHGEGDTHAMSWLWATLCVPAAWGCTQLLFQNKRAAWLAAILAATNPFLTYYAQETRMYSLVALLAMLTVTAWTLAFVRRDRRAIPFFIASATLLAYTHNWGLFLLVATGTTLLPALIKDRDLLRDAVIGYGGLLLLYAPWLPSLLSQAKHTAAPWSVAPTLTDLVSSFGVVLGRAPAPVLLFAGGLGLAGAWTERRAKRPGDPEARAIVLVTAQALVLAWLSSQASPAWAGRYLAIIVGPLLLIAGIGLARAGRAGLVTVALVMLFWVNGRTAQLDHKSDAHRVAVVMQERGWAKPGDLVMSDHPEQGPLLRYYLGPGLRWANLAGNVTDPKVMDWRDVVDRVKATDPVNLATQLAGEIKPGQHLLLMQPIIRTGTWNGKWTKLIRHRAPVIETTLDADPRLRRLGTYPKFKLHHLARGVRAIVYLRR